VKLAAGQSQRLDASLKALPPPPTPPPQQEVVDPSRVHAQHEVDVQPRKRSGASAAYPERAPRLRSGESISVQVAFVVSENGDVGEVRVLESGGKVLDEAVIAAVKGWKYTPGQKRGVNVKVQMQLKQTFKAG
jgi:protein TonB